MTDDHLAWRADHDILVLLVDDADVDARGRSSERTGTNLARRLVIEQHAYHFGHAPDFDQRKAEPLFEHTVELRLGARPKTKADAVAALFVAFGIPSRSGTITPR